MKSSEKIMTINEYIQHTHLLIDRFSSTYRTMNNDDPCQYPIHMSKSAWKREFFVRYLRLIGE